MKPHKFPPPVGRALLVLIFGLAISFSSTAIALTPSGWDKELANGNPDYSKTTEPDASGGYTERTYYTDPTTKLKQLVEIKKFNKAKALIYNWLRTPDDKGNTIIYEYTYPAAGGQFREATKTVVDKDGNTTTYTWDKGDWRFKSKTPKAASSGPKRAPGAPELETEPGNILPGRTYTRPTSTRGAYPKFELDFGYSHMQTDGEEVGQLNGFNTSAFYNVYPWLAVGGQFSGLYGTKTIGDVDVSLDRYLYLFGARVSSDVIFGGVSNRHMMLLRHRPILDYPEWKESRKEYVQLYGQVLIGGVHDSNDVCFTGGCSSSSADAFAMSIGVGADFQITNSFSLGPSFDYVPTNFSGANGNNWQNNWRVNLTGRINFGGRRPWKAHWLTLSGRDEKPISTWR